MNELDKEQEFLKTVRSSLDGDLDRLGPAVTQRLRESRQQAVELAEKKPFSLFALPRLAPIGGFATLAVVAMSVSLWFSLRPAAVPNKAEEIEVLMVQGNLDMYRDLEFFQWLAKTNEPR
jgi:hypothetical protein